MRSANHIVLGSIAAALLVGGAQNAFAYEPGQFIGRVGVATVSPDEDSDAIIIPTNPQTVLPNGVKVDSDTQLGLAGTYMLADHVGIEVLVATPFKHTSNSKMPM